MNNSLPKQPCEALVVGAGPVGLTMALELTRYGLGCRIVDEAPQATDKSKALVLWSRSLELLEQSGDVAVDFLPAGMLAAGTSLYAYDQRLVHVKFERRDTAFPQPLMIPQNETERILTQRLAARGVNIERLVQLITLRQEGDVVISTLRHADGREEQVTSSWVLGCDGSHSTARHALGIEFGGEFEPNDWILADINVDGPLAHDEISIYWHKCGIAAFFPIGGSRRFRVIADLGKAANTAKPADPTLEEVQAAINARGLEKLRLYDPFWLSGFRIHERKVNEYGRGRVLLAGDAAHIHSPAGGQGMNTGMQDAFNLAWKLALVHQGRAPFSPLLDSYNQERNEVGELVLHNAGRMTTVATLRNPVLQFVRNHVAHLASKFSLVQERFVGDLTELSIHYPHSELNGDDAGSAWSNSVKTGDRLPDADVLDLATGEQTRLLKSLNPTAHRLLLLPAAADMTGVAPLLAAAHNLRAMYGDLMQTVVVLPAPTIGVPFTQSDLRHGETLLVDAHDEVCERLGLRGTAIALVRPDGYLCFRGHAESWTALSTHLATYLSPMVRQQCEC